MDANDTFGDWLRRRRVAYDLTRTELASCAGCSVSALRKIEAGERRPSKQLAELLADCLDIPPEDRPAFTKAARGALGARGLAPPSPVPSLEDLSSTRPPCNLPNWPTPLVGRESELAAVATLMQEPECRLLTIVGPGGIGKTRVAVQAASMARNRYREGVYFVPLAGLGGTQHVAPALTNALGLTVVSATDPARQLVNYLQPREVLLLLDAAEQLLGGFGVVSDLVQGAPDVRLLITSRRRLGLPGEWEFELHGLPFPPPEQTEGLEANSAVALFVQAARRVRGGRDPCPEDLPHVARICRLVEGMPLAVELAAAWAHVLSCAEIADEIESSPDLLAMGLSEVSERHRSLKAVFDQTWQLLSEEERVVLRRISVFRGGFDRPAAEEVTGATLPVLLSLVDKSAIRRHEDGRYDAHQLMQQYAEARLLEDPGDFQATGDRHSAYYSALVQRREADLKCARQAEALGVLSAEIDNIRQGWHWAASHGQTATIRSQVRGLWVFYDIRGWYPEAESALRWSAECLARTAVPGKGAPPDVLCAYLRANRGWFCLKLGRLEEARAILPPSVGVLRSRGADEELLDGLYFLGVLEWLTGDYATARGCFEEELSLATRLGHEWNTALAHGNLALTIQAMGDYETALQEWQTTLDAVRGLRDPRLIASALQFLGRLKRTLGAHDEARELLDEGLRLSKIIGDRWVHGLTLVQLAQIARARGRRRDAVRLFHSALAALREIGEAWSTLQALNGLGMALLEAGDVDEATDAFGEALGMAWEIRALPAALTALYGLANWRVVRGDVGAALEDVVLVLQHPATDRETRDRAIGLYGEIAPGSAAPAPEAPGEGASALRLEARVHDALALPGAAVGRRCRGARRGDSSASPY